MPAITFLDHEGRSRTISVRSGQSLMVAAVGEGIDGIDAECGGACNCATCHVYVATDWINRVPAAGQQEIDILAEVPGGTGRSRLSCQIELTDALDGLVVSTPAVQGW